MKTETENATKLFESGGEPSAVATPPARPPPGVTPGRLAAVLQAAGYRATIGETNGFFEVKSAAQGLNFFIRFGNPAGPERQYLDFTFFCPLAVKGELAQAVLDLWNGSRRFGRLTREQQLLVLTMDVLAAGGVPDLYLSAQCELWDGIIRDMILHLRQSGSSPAPASPAEPGLIAPTNGAERH